MSKEESDVFDDMDVVMPDSSDNGKNDDVQDDDASNDSRSENPISSFHDALHTLQIERLKLILTLQKEYSAYVKTITKCWLIFIFITFAISGICNAHGLTFLSDKVLVMLITGTSVGVIFGLISTIIKALFIKNYK